MKTIYLLRHAKSSWTDSNLSDHQRPLNNRGRTAAPRMGQFMAERDLIPDAILCSTAVRASETMELLLPECEFSGPIEYTDDLYMAPVEQYLVAFAALPDQFQSAMAVGHNPGIANMVAHLTGQSTHFPTATLAKIELPIESWAELNASTRGKLIELWRPKELD